MNLFVNPKRILIFLLIVNVILLILNICGLVYSYSIDNNLSDKVVTFDFNSEYNIPTYYSSLLFFLNFLLLIGITFLKKEKNENYYYWLSLSLIFVFLATDEILMIHERINQLSRDLFSTSGLFYFAWVIPYSIVLLALVIVYFKLFLDLPKKSKYLFLISGFIFIFGSVGMEMLGGKHVEIYSRHNLTYAVYYTIEEFLEMMGLIIFIYSLLDYIANYFGNQINIKFKNSH